MNRIKRGELEDTSLRSSRIRLASVASELDFNKENAELDSFEL